jgi:Ca2+-binding RTX toxin-like protein
MRSKRLDRRLATAALVALVLVLASTMLHTSPALAVAAGSEAIHVHTALPVADATHSVIVKLIGDGEMQVTSPDDDTEIRVSHASVTFSNLPTIATAPCVAQATFPYKVVCPVDQVKSVLVLTGAGDDAVNTLVGDVPVTVITGDGNDTVTDNSVNLNTVLHDLFLLGDGDDRAGFGNSTGVANDVFGGPGRDEVEYGNALSVSISLDDVANDGPLKDDSPVPTTRDDNIRSDVEDITGGLAADILIGSDSNNLILGGGDTDTIRGLGGDDTMNGDGDISFLFANTDLIDGGDGTDTVSYDERSASVNVSLDGVANDGDPAVAEADNVINTENIIGGGGNDTLTGNSAGNIIQGLGGADVIDGAAGKDTVSYDDRSAPVNVSLDGVANDGDPAVAEADNVINTENIIGGNGGDTLTGNSAGNIIRGLGGNDTIAGGAGPDLIDGGGGTDTATYADHVTAVAVSLDGLANDGTTGELDNVVNTENLIGGGSNDILTGDAGPNVIRGLGGSDQLRGLAGNDVLVGDTGTDLADGGAGSDLCRAERVISCP